MKRNTTRHQYWCILLTCVVLLLPLFWLALYVRPSADDYDYALLTHEAILQGGSIFALLAAAWNTVVKFYMIWQGTYSSAFVMSLQPGIWGPKAYIATPFLILAFSFVCILFAAYYVNLRFVKKSRLYPVTLATVILTILYLWIPSPCQGLFWFNGAAHYIPWFFLTLVNITLIFEMDMSHGKRRKYLFLFASVILSFIISGGNQITAFANILLMLAFLILAPGRRRLDALLPLCFAVLGFIIMFVAPGNALRQSNFERKTALETVIRVLRHSIPLFSSWISFDWVISLVIMTPLALDIARHKRREIPWWVLILSVLISFAVLCGMLCVIYMPTGSYGDGRVTNVIWFAFMFFSWICYCILWVYLIGHKIVEIGPDSRSWQWTVITIACLAMLFAGQSRNARSSSFDAFFTLRYGAAQQYAAELDARYPIYNDPSVTEVALAPLSSRPALLFHLDLETDPSQWPNNTLAQYYHKDAVYILSDSVAE